LLEDEQTNLLARRRDGGVWAVFCCDRRGVVGVGVEAIFGMSEDKEGKRVMSGELKRFEGW